jgi:hypothetical protein
VPRVSSFSTQASATDARSSLIERVAQSRYIAKSARLHDLLVYLCDRVMNDGAIEIHEQEVGHAVFGRAKDYDTALDNIVRVHASTLRKRLEQFFAEEGLAEPLIIELPKGNYAPVFRERPLPEAALPVPEPPVAPQPPRDARLRIAAGLAVLFACTSLFLLWRVATVAKPVTDQPTLPPAVRSFWSGVFLPNQKTDIVLDDAALGLYQELDGRPISLSEYFDRSYLRRLGEKPGLKSLDSEIASPLLLKRQSSYSSISLLWQFSHTASALGSDWAPHFARDYAFRELKTNRAILLGNSRSNPWIEQFQNELGIRWLYDAAAGIYYPVDNWSNSAQYHPAGVHPDGYSSIALVPNLSGTGNMVILSGTGGAAAASAAAFLVDGERMAQLRAKLPATPNGQFPYFEALLKIPSRSRLPKDAELVICRPTRK